MGIVNWRKFQLAHKLWFGFGFLILILTIMAVIAYWQADHADEQLNQIMNVEIPSEQAVLEIKASVNEIDWSLLAYSRDENSAYLDTIDNSEVLLKSSITELNILADEDQVKQWRQQLTDLFNESSKLRSEIITLIDQQSAALKILLGDIEEISESIDDRLITQIDPEDPYAATKLDAAYALDQDMMVLSILLSDYTSEPDAFLQQEFQGVQSDFKNHIEAYQGAVPTNLEESWLAEISDDFDDVVSDGNALLSNADGLSGLLVQHEKDMTEITAIMDTEIQPLLDPGITKSETRAEDSLKSIRMWAIILGLLGLIFGGILVLIVSSRIVKSLRGLQTVAKTVADGKIEQRFYIDAKDEFGQVALTLNQMLENIGRSREALGESEETAWQILDATTDSVILMDLRGTILASNEVAAARFDKSLEQMIDASYYDLLPADLMASRKSQIAEVIKNRKPFHFEEDRKGMVLDTRIFPVIDQNNGRVTRVSIFARDITTRKWVEEVTEHLGRRNELILEAAGEGIYGLDTQGKTTFVNPAAARMLGYKPGDLIGQYHHELVHHSKSNGMPYPSHQCPIYAAFNDGIIRKNVDDEVFWRKDGTSFQVEYTSTPIIEGGKIVGAVVTFRDITERKKVEIALRRGEERYRALFESSTTLIISVDKEGMIVDCNARAKRTLGYDPEDIRGRNLVQLVHPDYRSLVEEILKEVLIRGFEYNKQFKMIQKNGMAVEVNMNAASVKDEYGEYMRTICMLDDISERICPTDQQMVSGLSDDE